MAVMSVAGAVHVHAVQCCGRSTISRISSSCCCLWQQGLLCAPYQHRNSV